MTVSKILKQIIDSQTTKNVVIGQLGLGSITKLKQLITLLAHHKDKQLTLKLFVDISDTSGILLANEELTTLLCPQGSISLTAIEGCQRVIVSNCKLTIDFYLGQYLTQLQALPMVNDGFVDGWHVTSDADQTQLRQILFWQLAKLSKNDAQFSLDDTFTEVSQLELYTQAEQVGLYRYADNIPGNIQSGDEICFQERAAMRAQSRALQAPYPICSAAVTTHATCSNLGIAIIGGGVASACLALSLAERGQQVTLFCEDHALAQAASGNKQGAIYPLLTPDNNTLSQYFQQAYLFSLQRLKSLAAQGHPIDFDLCGVVHTGHDERSRKRVAKIINGQNWQPSIARAITAEQASSIAGLKIDDGGIFYPMGGWVSPQDFTRAAFNQAKAIAGASLKLNTQITDIHYKDGGWELTSNTERFGSFKALILANGKSITQFPQTQYLQATGFRGQVSHVPSRAKLSKLSSVLCAHGYMTPSNNTLHCLGASYVKNAPNTDYCPNEQVENLHKIQHSYVGQEWVEDIDVSGHSARVGVRMVTRDHAPMMGPAPDIDSIMTLYQDHQLTPQSRKYWQSHNAPVHQGLYVLGGLGSRGLSSGPLAAESLAAQICGDLMPISRDFVALLNPNRMWMRKLLKGKALEVGVEV
ncbi:bifunctional tRNA (5-methylaminomethyl-2-thiouridine)(34)-methyltransferase MnmD/FAD-dependent 5-carboxymethylaminomethyl-2-thiouridine(34) oxidoreductase MnmC [Shewanella pealeana]|uniref:tRNA 5-methylaminomethyl-2-thiouridine biosynthesis bifunctional protein MnmC n=1 Tax=Shewanella pealeana (strain ATCC 700345 / ANG-SQ1) TaxID=398579 RepID=MNMC_SHEPA|nr:bifunctional tRNA (5-methylaminomethyl-2-thiouridine)(34)-methyltransferase MnmD/FAD-dependent 5-carboxymethylaminomethyl-2-thiouridine(34) oxidoreductase MnmC [Shewanella pealeana]A8H2Z3.1 RecName: Full=tRNA 5-methylaminomethyl-2-thiouridine biosynthesis bifunctional protein MnmC; Short=tRNA mnm(5)s(2)U biosynthesis bifunctional protein; Includes: RecName: Full=tRNA (mnm(5)s(2)U34)-methyltransferase; Includes: RecName: Full=FAD-dependent cmnm(5)s(2)U34 oxidoreductase [Shewanella pealeana ATCC 